MAASENKRNAYRQLLRAHGVEDLSDENVERYIRHARRRMAIYLPIVAVLLAWTVYAIVH